MVKCIECGKRLNTNHFPVAATVVTKPSTPLADIRLFCSRECRTKNAHNTLSNDVIDKHGFEIMIYSEIRLSDLLTKIKEDFYQNVERDTH